MQSDFKNVGNAFPSFDVDGVWQAFINAPTAAQRINAWLEVLCGLVPGVKSGLLVLEDSEGSFAPVSLWPPQTDLQHLGPTAEKALRQRQGVVNNDDGALPCLGYPLFKDSQLQGAVVIELAESYRAQLTQAMRITYWGAGWLADLFNQEVIQSSQLKLAQSGFLFDVVLAEFGNTDYHQASLAVVNKLAEHFQCHQVLLGMEKGRSIEMVAVSHSAWFDQKSQWIQLAIQAMNEAFDQRSLLNYASTQLDSGFIQAAHRRYGQETGSQHICSLPLESGIEVIGVLMLEREKPFTSDELSFLDTLALALAPVLALKKQQQESLFAHARRSIRHHLTLLTGPAYPGLKLVSALLSLILLVLMLTPGTFRVSAPAVIEGAIQRSMVAPFDGFIREAPVRAGDVLQAGELILTLEDKDLQLERVRWESELDVALRKEREAMAKADRVSQRQATAQANQARAQLSLTLERLNRVAIRAPFAGVIVKGDLSQKLGSPVQQGDVQFELAPLDAWRVILKVDERDIDFVKLEQVAELVLTSLPQARWPLRIEKITPVALAEEGHNYFRVEAKLIGDARALRPNMEGVGKIVAGERSLLWIGTHRLVDWVRLMCWEWLP